MPLELVTANLAGKTRRLRWRNREYFVVPASLINPGVLNGSQGPLLYELEHLRRNPHDWNHMPIVVYHPQRNGRLISARSPDVLEKFQIGSVYNAAVDDKLRSELWFDVEDTKRVDEYFSANDPEYPAVYPRLEAGEPVELSTGLFTDNVPAPEGAVYNGKRYVAVAVNYRPDHLAILPDQRGACSISDGCGVLVNTEGTNMPLLENFLNVFSFLANKDTAALPKPAANSCCAACADGRPCASTTSVVNDAKTPLTAIAEQKHEASAAALTASRSASQLKTREAHLAAARAHAEAAASLKSKDDALAAHHRKAAREHRVKARELKANADSTYAPVGNTDFSGLTQEEACEVLDQGEYNGGQLTEDEIAELEDICNEATDNQYAPSPSPMFSSDADPDSLEGRIQEVNEAFMEAHPPQYDTEKGYLCFCRLVSVYDDHIIYEEDGGGLYSEDYTVDADGDVTLSGSPVPVERVVTYEPDDEPSDNADSRRSKVKRYAPRLDYDPLVDVLTSFTDTLHSPESAFNLEPGGNMALSQQDKDTIKNRLKANIHHPKAAWKGKNLEAASDDLLVAWHESLLANSALEHGVEMGDGSRMSYNSKTRQWIRMVPVAKPVNNQDQVPVAQVPAAQVPVAQVPAAQVPAAQVPAVQVPVANGGRRMTMEQWLQSMPPEAQPAWNSITALHNQQKAALIEQLTANHGPDTKPAAVEMLSAMGLPQLQVLAAGVPPAPQHQHSNEQPSVLNFLGNIGGPPVGSGAEEPLPEVTYDFKRAV